MTATPSPDLYPALVRIVDDEETVRRSESFALRVVGIDVVTYESARDFLDHDDLRHPGCVVLDVRMPGMSGLELQQEMLRRGIDALFCPGGSGGIIAAYALSLFNRRVPEDISLIASEQTFFSRYGVPPQTTISPDYKALAASTADLIEARIGNLDFPRRTILPYILNSRESVR